MAGPTRRYIDDGWELTPAGFIKVEGGGVEEADLPRWFTAQIALASGPSEETLRAINIAYLAEKRAEHARREEAKRTFQDWANEWPRREPL